MRSWETIGRSSELPVKPMTEDRPTRDAVLIQTAVEFSKLSTCSRLRVGAVIAMDGRILSTGYNGVPAGMTHCNHSCECTEIAARKGDDLESTDFDFGDDDHYDICPADLPCLYAIHAETNAIAYAARHGVSVIGAAMLITSSPCLDCAKLILAVGIIRVRYILPYRKNDGLTLLDSRIDVAPWTGGYRS